MRQSSNPSSRQHFTRSRSSRIGNRITPPEQSPRLRTVSAAKNQQPLWRYPLFWAGLIIVLLIIALRFIEWHRTTPVIAPFAGDVSDSGLDEAAIGESICRAQTQALKPGDTAIDVWFADTTEPMRSSKVQSVTQMFPRCRDFAKQQRPATLGHAAGTSPILLFDRLHTQIAIQRNAGNPAPIAAIVWLQAAEPGPNLPALDFDLLGQQIAQITRDRGLVTIIGPTGQLREALDKLSAQNAALQICHTTEHQTCIRNTFEAARSLPPRP